MGMGIAAGGKTLKHAKTRTISRERRDYKRKEDVLDADLVGQIESELGEIRKIWQVKEISENREREKWRLRNDDRKRWSDKRGDK